MWYFYNKQLSQKDLFEIPKIDSNSKFMNFVNKINFFLVFLGEMFRFGISRSKILTFNFVRQTCDKFQVRHIIKMSWKRHNS